MSATAFSRDALRGENAARRQQRGLVSSEELLIDFEKRRCREERQSHSNHIAIASCPGAERKVVR